MTLAKFSTSPPPVIWAIALIVKILFSLTNTENFSSFDNYLQNLKQKAQLEDKFDKLGIDINKDYQKISSVY